MHAIIDYLLEVLADLIALVAQLKALLEHAHGKVALVSSAVQALCQPQCAHALVAAAASSV